MTRAWFSWVVFCALAATLGCRSPSSDWNGTWKLNPSKSSFQGPTFTISISKDGEYGYDDENSRITLSCDGKDRPIGENRTRACVKSGTTAFDLIRKENGVKTSANHWELSRDGEVLTVTAIDFRPSGPVMTTQIVASRISGSGDFGGEWRNT
jgi:hypothetical protein